MQKQNVMEGENIGNSKGLDPSLKPWETPKLIIENTDNTMGGGGGPSPSGDDSTTYDS